MKKILILFLFMLMKLFAQNYQLVWSDEFNSSSLNSAAWTFDLGNNNGWGNNELETYTNSPNNIYIQNGYLYINARKESNGSYTSARIKTEGLKSFQYGKIEARMKLPYGQGLWPAFWMLGDNISSVGWPSCGEIDIMEMIGGGSGRDNTVHGSAHWGGDYTNAYSLSSGILADTFHVYDVTWTPTQIAWHIDGIQYALLNTTPSALNAFSKPFFIILNLAVGGSWPGNPNGTTVFPQQLVVDYVRVYQNTSGLPKINLSQPLNNSTFSANSDILLNADVQYSGKISKVEFFQGALKIGESDVSPYQMTWRNVSPGNYTISATATTDSGFQSSSNIDTIIVGSSVESPYSGSPAKIPGTIYAINYDLGGPNVGYYNTTLINNGGQYRNDGVGIESCADSGGGYDVGWINQSEWLKYSVNVKDSGLYNFNFRVSSGSSQPGTFHVEMDGVNVTGSITVPSTGGWQVWATVSVNNIKLTKGFHIMKVVFDGSGFNFYKIDIIEPGLTGALQIISPSGGEVWNADSIKEIRWDSYSISDLIIGLSTNGGTSWSTIAADAPAIYGFYRFQLPNISSQNCFIKIYNKNNLAINIQNSVPFSIDNQTEIKNNSYTVKDFRLKQNYPNPFNPSTNIIFSFPERTFASLSVYDILGKSVANLFDGFADANRVYDITFNGANLKSGIYFYQLRTKSGIETKKMILLK